MRQFLIIAILALAGSAFAAVSAQAGRFTVEVTSQPSPPKVGENVLILKITNSGKPLSGAGVSVHLDMTSMPMPADAQAAASSNAGEYGATINLSMAGQWTIAVAVRQMAGMPMAGDGTAHFLIETDKSITAVGGKSMPWTPILVGVLLAIMLVTLLGYRRIPPQRRGVVVGLLTLAVVLAGTVTVVKKYRDPKQTPVLESAFMDMDAQAAPGTVAVAAETVHAAPFQASASYTGTVAPDQEEDVYPRVMGRLSYLPFYPGDRVAAGQVVARLDAAELSAKASQAAYGSAGATQGITVAQADVATARAARTKSEKLVAQAQAQVTQAQAAVRGAESGVTAAQSELNSARQLAKETDSAVVAAQAGIEQANEAVTQAQAEVDSTQADATYWTTEIAREKKLYEQGAVAKEELDRETAQAAAATAKLNQAKSAVRNAQAGVNRARQEHTQAQARQAAAQTAITAAEARVNAAQAEREGARGRVTETEAAVQAAKADVSTAEAGIAGASAKVSLADAQARQAKAALTEAGAINGYTVIRAATGGVVTARNVAPGVVVQPGMSILKIAKIDYLRLQVNVSAADLAGVRIGQPITAHDVNAPDLPIHGRVSAIFPASDTTARTAIVEARVPNPGNRLHPGEYVSVELALDGGQRPTLSVPSNAVQVRDTDSSVFLIRTQDVRSIARRVPVTIGRLANARTEIIAGLHDGDQVITSGLANLRDGDAVTVVKQ